MEALDRAIQNALNTAAEISAKMIDFQARMEPLKTAIGVSKQQFG
jgi:hypothetical protein